MKNPERTEALMEKGSALARQCASAEKGPTENQVAMVLAHLKRHRDPKATVELLKSLPRSPFARRTKSTRLQYEALGRLVTPILQHLPDWREAAVVLGWAKRLHPVYKRRSH